MLFYKLVDFYSTESMRSIEKISKVLGFSFFEKQKPNRRVIWFLSSSFFIYSLMVYTIGIEIRAVLKVFQASLTVSLSTQALVRYFLYIRDPEPFLKLRDMAVEFYITHNNFHDRREIITENSVRTRKFIRFLVVFYFSCYFGPPLYCLYKIIFYGELLTPAYIILPFFDRDSLTAFIIVFIMQIFGLVFLCVGFTSYDSVTILYVAHLVSMVEIFKIKMVSLSNDFADMDLKLPENRKAVKEGLAQIMACYGEIKEYFEWLKTLMTVPCLVVIFCNTYVVCTGGIAILTSSFYGAVGFSIQATFILLIICGLGTVICVQHERLLAILNRFNWYTMHFAEQKDWLLFLVQAQQGFGLEPIFIGTINMELFITVNSVKY